ncbi:MAG: hypothetical protein JW840_10750 [Candidatus Thermoplasmatota archaeon]|nr:hypothetical protein [Candidatus Thermoplasmatota archaeon]
MPRGRGGGGFGRCGGRGLGGGYGIGPGGECLCPNCGHREPHSRGLPCSTIRCPRCGSLMIRG